MVSTDPGCPWMRSTLCSSSSRLKIIIDPSLLGHTKYLPFFTSSRPDSYSSTLSDSMISLARESELCLKS